MQKLLLEFEKFSGTTEDEYCHTLSLQEGVMVASYIRTLEAENTMLREHLRNAKQHPFGSATYN